MTFPVVAADAPVEDMSTSELIEAMPSSLTLASIGRIYNPEAPVPPQCYTQIEGKYNPCYVCHQNNDDKSRPNFMQDGSLQQAYEFSEAGLTNHHRNLFIDRSADVDAISDKEIINYINTDNYSPLVKRLKKEGFPAWIPDLENYQQGAKAFDPYGHALDGSHWVAFNYKPQPSTFWPTNGSTDDVLIRLPNKFRNDSNGNYSRDVYVANLALLEMAFQDLESISLPEIDERNLGLDLNGDGKKTKVGRINRSSFYVGGAQNEKILRMNYPQGTEFMHSVRYVGIQDDGSITLPKRMKELRYMIKTRQLETAAIRSRYSNELQEKIDENLPRYIDLGNKGMDTGFGWTLQAFIEDANGDLRHQTKEELFFCRGCHSTVGANIDQTWAFPRKVTGAAGWTFVNLEGMPDAPNLGQKQGEILTYFQRAGGGDEFRSNTEMLDKWFDENNQAKLEQVKGRTVDELIFPSIDRALLVNKAYRTIVKNQSFIYGRDATITPPINVHDEIDEATAPTLPEDKRYNHDIRLDWVSVGFD